MSQAQAKARADTALMQACAAAKTTPAVWKVVEPDTKSLLWGRWQLNWDSTVLCDLEAILAGKPIEMHFLSMSPSIWSATRDHLKHLAEKMPHVTFEHGKGEEHWVRFSLT